MTDATPVPVYVFYNAEINVFYESFLGPEFHEYYMADHPEIIYLGQL